MSVASWPQDSFSFEGSLHQVHPGVSSCGSASGSSSEDVFSAPLLRLFAKPNRSCCEVCDADANPSPVLGESELSGIPLVYCSQDFRSCLTSLRAVLPLLQSRYKRLASVSISFWDNASSRSSTRPWRWRNMDDAKNSVFCLIVSLAFHPFC